MIHELSTKQLRITKNDPETLQITTDIRERFEEAEKALRLAGEEKVAGVVRKLVEVTLLFPTRSILLDFLTSIS
jgi:hypothetical protein